MLEYEVHLPAGRTDSRSAEKTIYSPPTIILLHGYGADELDLLPFAEFFDPRFLTISIRAPYQLPQGGYAWYKLAMTPSGFTPDDPSRLESEKMLLSEIPLILKAENGSKENLILMGFSQGSAMCFSLLAKHNLAAIGMRITGLVALSGYIPEDSKTPLRLKNLFGLPVFIGHGMYDELIPMKASELAEEILEGSAAVVSKHTYLIGHGVAQEELRDIASWLNDRLENV